MRTSLQIKQIHTLKNILGLDDDLYREMLASFGVYSSKKLTETEANILIEILQDKTKKLKLAKPKKYDDLSERDSKMSTPLQLRKAIYLCCHDTARNSHNKFKGVLNG